jgi:hypothetical protein
LDSSGIGRSRLVIDGSTNFIKFKTDACRLCGKREDQLEGTVNTAWTRVRKPPKISASAKGKGG